MKYIWIFAITLVWIWTGCEDVPSSSSATTDMPQQARSILTESMDGIIIPAVGGGTLYRCSTAEPVVFSDSKEILRKSLPDTVPYGATLVGTLELAVSRNGEGFELKSVGVVTEQWWKSECIMVQHLQALGNEPGWELRIDPPNELVLKTNYGMEESAFPFVLPKYEIGRWTYDVVVGMGENADSLSITITDKPCQDNMAGNTFPMTAQANLNGDQMEGCARDLSDAPQIR